MAIEDVWGRLPLVAGDAQTLAARVGLIPAIDRGSLAGAAFDQLRTQLLRVLKANDWRRIGITSPARRAGRSFFSVGLAASIARLDAQRVLLIDADLEQPGLSGLLGIPAPGPTEEVLTAQREPESQLVRIGGGLVLALNDTPVPLAAEAFLAPDAILALRAMIDLLAPDVVLLDMPPLMGDPVAQSLLAKLDAVLLISDATHNTAHDIIECERLLEGQVPLLGVALNKSEDRDPRRPSPRRS